MCIILLKLAILKTKRILLAPLARPNNILHNLQLKLPKKSVPVHDTIIIIITYKAIQNSYKTSDIYTKKKNE